MEFSVEHKRGPFGQRAAPMVDGIERRLRRIGGSITHFCEKPAGLHSRSQLVKSWSNRDQVNSRFNRNLPGFAESNRAVRQREPLDSHTRTAAAA